jgi:hypothetical protein
MRAIVFTLCLSYRLFTVSFSNFYLVHWNHQANLKQAWHECSLGSTLQSTKYWTSLYYNIAIYFYAMKILTSLSISCIHSKWSVRKKMVNENLIKITKLFKFLSCSLKSSGQFEASLAWMFIRFYITKLSENWHSGRGQ